MNLNIGICEDDLIHIDILSKHIEETLKLKELSFEIYKFKSGEELLKNYPNKLDILFLDIQMKVLTGMDTARKLREFDKNVEIIFTTSVSDYVYEGYEVRAYRYLLKPLRYEVIEKHLIECISNILDKEKNYLVINNKNNLTKIMLEDVLYIETQGRELLIHKKDNLYMVKMSMRKIEKLLEGKKFFRCHNSFIVNLDKVECIDKNIVYINKVQIPVSKHRIQSLKKELTNLLGAIIC
jgi:DNA-binding LytR/AlgR family response regulator